MTKGRWSKTVVQVLPRRIVRLAAAGLLSALVTGCGFAPMYGRSARSPAATAALHQIAIAPIPDRLGHDFRNALIDRISAGQSVTDPHYRLDVHISSNEYSTLVQSDSSVSRYAVTIETPFKLIDIKTHKVLLHESARVITSYDVPASEYAATVTQKDADERALHQLAAEIALRIGSYLETKPASRTPLSPFVNP